MDTAGSGRTSHPAAISPAPRVAIADGSNFRGSIDMQRKEPPGSTEAVVDALDRHARAPKLVAASVTDELVRV